MPQTLEVQIAKSKDTTNQYQVRLVSTKGKVLAAGNFAYRLDPISILMELLLYSALALSLLTQNTYPGSFTKAHIDSTFDVDIPFDPAKIGDLLILNDSTTPLDPRDLTSLAYNVSLKLRYFGHLVRLGYKSIGSEYYSLGNNFLRRDIQGWYASDRMRLFKNRLYLTLGIENYDDNFSQKDGNPKMDLSTYNFAISYFPGQNYPRVNVNFRSHLRNNGVDSLYTTATDSLVYARGEDNLTRDYSIQIAHDLNLLNLHHTVSLNWINSDRFDQLQSSKAAGSVSTDLATDIRMVSLRTRFNSGLTTMANYAWNQNVALGGESQFKYQMFDLSGEYKLLAGSLAIHGGFRRIAADGMVGTGATIEYNKSSLRLGAVYRPTGTTYCFVDINYINFSDKGLNADGSARPSYDDYILRTRLEKRF